MLSQNKVIELLKRELPFLALEYGVKKIGLFGSYAKGIQRGKSDIDILVEFEKPIGLKFVELADYLEKVLGRGIDILTPAGIKGIRIKKVARDIKRSIIYV